MDDENKIVNDGLDDKNMSDHINQESESINNTTSQEDSQDNPINNENINNDIINNDNNVQEQAAYNQDTGVTNKDFNMLVFESIESGIKPIEIEYYPIIDLDDGFPIAYRTKTIIHSIIKGTMKEEAYVNVSDRRPVGVDLFKRIIKYIMRGYKLFAKEDRELEFISLRCPSEFVTNINLYDTMKEILDENPSFPPSKLCLEFPMSLLDQETEKAKWAILDMKLLHVKTAVMDCGKSEFIVSKLLDIPVDYAYLDPTMTQWSGSRDKPKLLHAFINYLKSMNVIAIGVGDEEFRKPMRSTDAIGFYRIDTLPRTLEEAVGEDESE